MADLASRSNRIRAGAIVVASPRQGDGAAFAADFLYKQKMLKLIKAPPRTEQGGSRAMRMETVQMAQNLARGVDDQAPIIGVRAGVGSNVF